MDKRPSRPTASGRSSKTRPAGQYKAAGKLADGVIILAPKSKPKHFTSEEIKSTIRKLRGDKRSALAPSYDSTLRSGRSLKAGA
jgi:hypothetical protein